MFFSFNLYENRAIIYSYDSFSKSVMVYSMLTMTPINWVFIRAYASVFICSETTLLRSAKSINFIHDEK